MRSLLPTSRASFVVAAAVALTVAAGAADQQTPTFRSGSNLIAVDVSVVDKNGQPVTNLSAADFEIREDGSVQVVQALSLVSIAGTGTGTSTLAPGTLAPSTLEPWCLAPLSPLSRLSCGQQVARNRVASACIDISDGLADAVSQLAAASGTGARILSSNIPVDAVATLEQALSGGEDYELLFAVPQRKRRGFEAIAGREVPITLIGELTPGSGAVLDRDGRQEPLGSGFTHF